jgi:hypothetical protein
VIATITLIGTLTCLKTFGIIIVIVVGLVWNIFLLSSFQRNGCTMLRARTNNTWISQVGLIGCAVTLATNLTVLVGTIGMIGFFLFLMTSSLA